MKARVLLLFVYAILITSFAYSADWPSEGHDFQRRNFVSESLYTADLNLTATPSIYRDSENAYVTYSGPVAKAVALSQSLVVGSIDGSVRCFGKEGSLIWTFQTNGSIYSTASIVEFQGNEVVAIGSTDAYVYLLSLADGHLIWSKKLGGPVNTSPAVSDSHLIVTSNSGNVSALNLTDGSEVWTVNVGGYQWASPAITSDGSSIVVAGVNGQINCLNAQSGTVIWKDSFETSFRATPSMSHDRVYVSTADGSLLALRLNDGSTVWTFTDGTNTERFTSASQDIENGQTNLIFGSTAGKLFKVADSGSVPALIWQTAIGGNLYWPPTLSSSFGIISTKDNPSYGLQQFDISTGVLLSGWPLQGHSFGGSVAILANDFAYVVSNNNFLHVFSRLAASFTVTPTFTFTDTITSTPTFTATETPTQTDTMTCTPTETASSTSTSSSTWTNTVTASPSSTVSETSTSTDTVTPTSSKTETTTGTSSPSATKTNTATFTMTNTPTETGSATRSYTITPSATPTETSSATRTSSPTATNTPEPVPCVFTAIYANSGNSIHGSGTNVNSYDSILGSYGGNNIFENGSVRASNSVIINSGASIHGNVIQNSPQNLLVYPAPSTINNLGDLNIDGNYNFEPGDYVVNNLNVNGSGRISTSGGGRVRIWFRSLNLAGTITLGASSETAHEFWLFSLPDAQQLNVNDTATVYAVVYAPNVSVILNGGNLFGAVVGGSVTLNGIAAVHYDERLATSCLGGVPLPTPSHSYTPAFSTTPTATKTIETTPMHSFTETFVYTPTPSSTASQTFSQNVSPSSTKTLTGVWPSATFTPTVTTSPTPASSIAKLNLEIWNPGQTSTEYKIAIRISNHGSEPIALSRLKVKMGIFYSESEELQAASYANNQTIYSGSGGWVSNVDAVAVKFTVLEPAKDCGNFRKANRAVSFAFADASAAIPANGGYLQTNAGGATLATFHRSNWASFDRSMDYSRIADAGSSFSQRSNRAEVSLYLDGNLICEYVDASTQDVLSGREPCDPNACTGGAAGGGYPMSARVGLSPKNPQEHRDKLVVFPNPGRGDTFIKYSVIEKSRIQIQICDLTGRVIYSSGIEGDSSDQVLRLDTTKMASGIYFALLNVDRGFGMRTASAFKFAIVK